MEIITRKCGRCHNKLDLSCYIGGMKLCDNCLVISRERNTIDRESNTEKIAEYKKEYRQQHKEELKEKRREYQYMEYYCPVCLYTVKLYKKQQHCKSLIHINNLKYCDEQKQICILNSRIEHNILHNNIDEEVKKIVDEDIENNIIQKSLLDAIRNFNMKIENAMNEKY